MVGRPYSHGVTVGILGLMVSSLLGLTPMGQRFTVMAAMRTVQEGSVLSSGSCLQSPCIAGSALSAAPHLQFQSQRSRVHDGVQGSGFKNCLPHQGQRSALRAHENHLDD